MTVAYGWVILAIVNLGVYEYTQFWPSALLAAIMAGIAGAMFVGILREIL
jgi:hypothetical protein